MGNCRLSLIIFFLFLIYQQSNAKINITSIHEGIINRKSLVLTGRSEFLACYVNVGGLVFSVIIDTTINYLLIAKKKCDGCTQVPPFYKESPVSEIITCDSPTCHSYGNLCEKPNKFDPPTCGYNVTLRNGATVRANLIRELISVDDFKNVPVILAGIYEQNGGSALSQGILGIGPSCSTCPPSPVQTILSTLKKPYIFGISLDKNYFGGMSLGMIDPLLYSGSINYTKMSKIENAYSFLPSYIGSYWNGQILKIEENLKPFIFVSSSPLSYVPTPIFNQIKTFFQIGCKNDFKICSQIESLFNNTYCVNLTQNQIETFPNIEIYFNEGFTLTIPPKIYFYSVSKADSVYHCLGVLESQKSNVITIGINLMRELYIIFDNETNRIGFSKK